MAACSESWRTRRAVAALLYDDAAHGLAEKARAAAWRGFAGGAEWMRAALGAVRGGRRPAGCADFAVLGRVKYVACVAGGAGSALLMTMLVGASAAIAVAAAVIVFYAIEAQFVFLFPLALDGRTPGWRMLRRSVRRAGGTLVVMGTVMPIALRMLTGGLRSWCCGCLEVLLWYESLRAGTTLRALPRWMWGDGGPLLVREERTAVSPGTPRVRIAWVSDLHLGRRSAIRTVRSITTAVRESRPNLIVLGGDLVDSAAGLRQLERLIRAVARVSPVFALAGNHDRRVGCAIVREAVERAGGRWMEDGSRLPGHPAVVCLHDPAHAAAWMGRCALVLAGHLHGGQCVLFSTRGRAWPGAMFYRWCGPRFDLGRGTTLIVGRGVGDTLPWRWNCPREIVCCDLVPAAEREDRR